MTYDIPVANRRPERDAEEILADLPRGYGGFVPLNVDVAKKVVAIAQTSTVLVRRVGMIVVMATAERKVVLSPEQLATSPMCCSNPALHKEGASAATSLDTGKRSERHALYLHLSKCRQGKMQRWLIYLL